VSKTSNSGRVTFDNPPINLVSPEMLVELPELIDQMKAGE
jgi:enoyl-CoA hydratase/carnithine racemase